MEENVQSMSNDLMAMRNNEDKLTYTLSFFGES